MQSLRIRLILLLGCAIVAAAAIQFTTSFRAAMEEANKLFDFHMQQMAHTLKDSRVDHELDWYSLPDSRTEGFDFVVQFWTDGVPRVYQSQDYTVLPAQGKLGYSTVRLANGYWRLYVVESPARVVQIAQKIETRRARAISLAQHAVWPVVPVSILLFLAAWWVVTAALSPLNRIGRDLADRNADSLAPVSTKGVPHEVSLLIDELNSLLARMTQTLQSQKRFLADAAHELRSPLTALKLQVQALARARDENTQEQALGRLSGGVERASRLVEQLLVLARQDPLSREFNPAALSLRSCIQPAAEDVAALAASRRIELEYGDMVETPVLGDPEDLRVMIRNLLDNAIRYTAEGGRVRIAVAEIASEVILTIRDSGTGIPPQEQERVFDRFYRVPGTTAHGSGLGLAIVKTIAARHQATIDLRNVEGGLLVELHFPSHRSVSDTPEPIPEGIRASA